MLFLWSRPTTPGPRASPWFAWITTALILWRNRRSIKRAILAASPLRVLRRRTRVAPIVAKASIGGETGVRQHPHQQQRDRLQKQRRHTGTGIKARVKRLCTGDGPHVVSSATSVVRPNQQIHYKVTRSGRIYGRYQNKTESPRDP